MKKLLAILVVFTLVTGAVFAQTANGISVQAWGRAAFAPLVYVDVPKHEGEAIKDVDPESYAGTGASWGGDKARVDFRVNGDSDYVGFKTHLQADAGGVNVGDYAFIWAKPFSNDYLKLSAGIVLDDTLRGKIGNLNGGFENFVLPSPAEEDAIFARFGTGGTNQTNGGAPNSFMLSSSPIDALFIGLMINGALDPWWNGSEAGATSLDNAYRFMQLGFGYNIEGIGHVRAQFIGGYAGSIDPGSEDDTKYIEGGAMSLIVVDDDTGLPTGDIAKPAKIQLAFALTAVENLLVDLGVSIALPLEFKDQGTITPGASIGVGANYNGGAFGIGARVDASGIGKSWEVKDGDKQDFGMELVFRLVPTFNLDFGQVGLDVAFATKATDKDADNQWTQIGFGAFIGKGLGNGSVKAGLSYTLPKTYKDGAEGSGIFKIPVLLEYAFF